MRDKLNKYAFICEKCYHRIISAADIVAWNCTCKHLNIEDQESLRKYVISKIDQYRSG